MFRAASGSVPVRRWFEGAISGMVNGKLRVIGYHGDSFSGALSR